MPSPSITQPHGHVKIWIPLESDPKTFTVLAAKLGIQDLESLDVLFVSELEISH